MSIKIMALDELATGTMAVGDYLVVLDTDAAILKKSEAQNIWDSQIVAFAESIFASASADAAQDLFGLSAFAKTLIDDADAASFISTLGVDGDTLTLDIPASLTISAFGRTILDDSDASTVRTTIGADLGWTYGSQVSMSGAGPIELEGSVPSGTTEIEIILNGVSPDATRHCIIQLGDGGGYETTGYQGDIRVVASTVDNAINLTTGFHVGYNVAAGSNLSGIYRLFRWDTSEHLWFIYGGGMDVTQMFQSFGYKTLTAELDSIQITLNAGTFDAGEARVRYR